MYRILTVEDKIQVPPAKFNLPLEEAVKASLEDRWEGLIDRELGVILGVVEVGDVGEGKILPGNGAIHYPVTFRLLTYFPELHELIKGYVIDVTEFGVFIRMGPVDGMVHVSQIMDDFVTYDPKSAVFFGRESKRSIKDGDVVKARVISVSLEKQYKIGLTTRQPGLGCLNWAEKVKKAKTAAGKKGAKPAEKKGKKKRRR